MIADGGPGTLGSSRKRRVSIMWIAMIAPFPPVYAQSTVSQNTQASASVTAEDATRLEQIIVTAERKPSDLQKTPISVTVISGDELESRELHDPSQIRLLAPSLQANPVSQSPSNADFSIRGVGTTSFSNSTEYDVSTVIDDVVLARPELGIVQYFDLDRIEVLGGPQVTLFGKNASAGVVSIHTKQPKIGMTESQVNVEASQTNTLGSGLGGRAEAVTNLPLTTDSALRVTAFGIDQAPLVKNVFPGNQSHLGFEEGGVKVKYLWAPTEDFHIYSIADYTAERGAGQHAFSLRAVGDGAPYPAVLANSLSASGIVAGPDNLKLNANAPYDTKYSTGGAQVEAGYDLPGSAVLTNLLAWRTARMDNIGDSDATAVSYFDTVALDLHDYQWSDELRFSSGPGKYIDGQGGIYLLDGKFIRNTSAFGLFGHVEPPGTQFRGGLSYSTQYADSAAAFGQVVVHVAPSLRLIAGGRFTYDHIRLDVNSILGNAVTPFFPLGTLQQTRTNTNFSYKGGIESDLTANAMAYFTYTVGYKGPAFNNTASSAAAIAVNPEIPRSYEVGLKSDWFDHHVRLNLSAFSTTFDDFQTNSVDPVTLLTVLENAGSARTRGVEAQLTMRPSSHFSVSGGAAYVDAIYLSFLNSPCYTGQTVATGCRIVTPATGTTPAVTAFDASGQPLGNAPKFTTDLTVRYDMTLPRELKGSFSVSDYYRTRGNFSNNGNPYTWLGGYGTLDSDFGVSTLSDSWRVAIFVHNLLDKRFPGIIQANTGAPGTYQQGFSLNSFRTVGIQGTFNF
jgi:iron complex outermembrane recepter protein